MFLIIDFLQVSQFVEAKLMNISLQFGRPALQLVYGGLHSVNNRATKRKKIPQNIKNQFIKNKKNTIKFMFT